MADPWVTSYGPAVTALGSVASDSVLLGQTDAGVTFTLARSAFGTAAGVNTGTSGANVPLLNGTNAFSGATTFSNLLTIDRTQTQKMRLAGSASAMLTFANASADIAHILAQSDTVHVLNGAQDVMATITASGITHGGIELGYRDIPRVTGGIERGKCHAASSGITINTGPAAGSTYSIYNDSGSAITITQGSGLTLRLAGTGTTGNRTLAARGFATIWFNSTTEAIVSGSGVS
jgi:hypothetical protein